MSAHSEDTGAVKDAHERLDDKSMAIVEDRLADHIRAIVDSSSSTNRRAGRETSRSAPAATAHGAGLSRPDMCPPIV